MCMSEKEVKKVSPRVENIIKGLFIALLAIVFALNVGKVGRTLVFLPLYIFGASYYLLAAFLLFIGIYRIIRKKKFKFKKFYIAAGLLLVFLASLLIILIPNNKLPVSNEQSNNITILILYLFAKNF